MSDVEVRKLDPQGRLLIPGEWRREVFGGSSKVVMRRFKDHIIVMPFSRKSLTEFLDIIEVDVSPEVFRDYHRLKAVLMGKPHAVH